MRSDKKVKRDSNVSRFQVTEEAPTRSGRWLVFDAGGDLYQYQCSSGSESEALEQPSMQDRRRVLVSV